MPQIIAFSDIQFIFMEAKVAAQGFPSKVYTIMACGKPLLVCSPKNTPIYNFLEPLDCAKLVSLENPNDKAREINKWLNEVDKAQLSEMGRRGIETIAEKYSKEAVTQQYINLVNSI